MKRFNLFLSLLFVAFIIISVSANAQIHNGHKYVDLGLTSKTLWATTNIGATTPEKYGNYYAWGETTTKKIYTKDTYKSTLKKYSQTIELDLIDDAANVILGGKWRMPSIEQFEELKNSCYWKWTDSYNGKRVSGYIVYKAKDESDKGKYNRTATASYKVNSDVHIFLPAAGYYWEEKLKLEDFSYGYYWSRSRGDDKFYKACCLRFKSGDVDKYNYSRSGGRSIRPVCPRLD